MVPLISFVIPFFDEAQSLRPLFLEMVAVLDPAGSYEFIFVDDGSRDGSLEIVRAIEKEYGAAYRIRVLSFPSNRGKTEAFRSAFQSATGDHIITLDADLQDNPVYIPDFIRKIREDKLDMVVGNRPNRYKKNIFKLASTRLANSIVRLFFGPPIHDVNCGYKILSAPLAKSLVLKADYHRLLPVLAARAGYRVGELLIRQRERRYGSSKYGKIGLGRTFKFFRDLFSLIGADKPRPASASSNFKKYHSRNPLKRLLLQLYLRDIARLVKGLAFRSVLDFGCGEGYTLSYLRAKVPAFGERSSRGIDRSAAALESARALNPGSVFEAGSEELLEKAGGGADLVLCLEVLEHLAAPAETFKKLLAAAGSHLLVSVPNEPWFTRLRFLSGHDFRKGGRHPEHVNLWTKKSFRNFVRENGGGDSVIIKISTVWIIAIITKNKP